MAGKYRLCLGETTPSHMFESKKQRKGNLTGMLSKIMSATRGAIMLRTANLYTKREIGHNFL